jgi:hypothetical protein
MLALVHEGVRTTQIGAALHSNWMTTGLVGASGLVWSEPRGRPRDGLIT